MKFVVSALLAASLMFVAVIWAQQAPEAAPQPEASPATTDPAKAPAPAPAPGLQPAVDPATTPAPVPPPAPTHGLTSVREKVSYAIGHDIGNNLADQFVDVDPEIMLRGLRDGLTGKEPVLTAEEIQAAMQEMQALVIAKRTEYMKAQSEKNKTAGATFLTENGAKEGIKTTASGLQYKIEKEGQGASPSATDTVTVHYSGRLLDGTEFDSSYKRGEPATFAVNEVIPGWTEALQLMKPGAKFQLFIPSDLAYGPRGGGRTIPPDATLIFDVELIAIQPANAVNPLDPMGQ